VGLVRHELVLLRLGDDPNLTLVSCLRATAKPVAVAASVATPQATVAEDVIDTHGECGVILHRYARTLCRNMRNHRHNRAITCPMLYMQQHKRYAISSFRACVRQPLDTHYAAACKRHKGWLHAVYVSISIYSDCAVLIMVFALCDVLRAYRSKAQA
jgi:hypothetical protein